MPEPNEVMPVPPLPTGSVPVTLDARLQYVVEVEPVPPEAIGRAEPRVSEDKCVVASTTLVALLKTNMVLPAGTAIPVPDVFLTVIASAQVLLIRYSLSIWQPEPKIRSRAPPVVPIKLSRKLRAD
jgi:hypothetical protein